jgi:hypothetical protein
VERGWRSGPRLPATVPGAIDLILGDPAHGRRVDRCLTCGLPSLPGGKLLTFDLSLHGKAAGRYRLCERCWMAANPPQPADPLDVTEAA